MNTSSDTVQDIPAVVNYIPTGNGPTGDGGHVVIQINASQHEFTDPSDCFDDVHSEQDFTAKEEMPSSAGEDDCESSSKDMDKLLREDNNQSWKDVIMVIANKNGFVLPTVESELRMTGESPEREIRLFESPNVQFNQDMEVSRPGFTISKEAASYYSVFPHTPKFTNRYMYMRMRHGENRRGFVALMLILISLSFFSDDRRTAR